MGDWVEKTYGNGPQVASPGQYSIQINDQWCVCFVWTDKGPENVEIVDYH